MSGPNDRFRLKILRVRCFVFRHNAAASTRALKNNKKNNKIICLLSGKKLSLHENIDLITHAIDNYEQEKFSIQGIRFVLRWLP